MDSLKRSFKAHGNSSSSSSSSSYHRYSSSSPHDHESHATLLGAHDAAFSLHANAQDLVPPSPDAAFASPAGVIDAVNGGGAVPKIWREPSCDIWNAGDGEKLFSFNSRIRNQNNNVGAAAAAAEVSQDPPSRLISNFLHKQRASGADISIDVDLEMVELDNKNPSISSAPAAAPSAAMESKELRVSFEDRTEPPSRGRAAAYTRPSPSSSSSSSSSSDDDDEDGTDNNRRPSKAASPPPPCHTVQSDSVRGGSGDGGEVLRCTSNASFQRRPSLLRAKTRSRLLDPMYPQQVAAPTTSGQDTKKSGRVPASGSIRSGAIRSGVTGKSQQNLEEDEEDPFMDDDIPDELKRNKLSLLTILEWVSLIVILSALVCSLVFKRLRGITQWGLHLWKWELLVFVLICGRLVSGWVIRVGVFFIERNFLLRKRVLYFVYGVRNAVQNCLWLGLVLLSWHFMFDKKVERETQSTTLPYVTKVLFCFLVATILWLVKTLLVKILASSFHVSTYFDRIQESLFNQYIIETLSGPPLIEIKKTQEEEERLIAEVQNIQNAGIKIPNDLRAAAFRKKTSQVIGSGTNSPNSLRKSGQIGKYVKLSGAFPKKDVNKPQEEGITIEKLHKLNQKNVSAWNMKRLMKIVRHGMLSTLDEKIAQQSGEDESTMQIRSEYEAKVAAKNIFMNAAKPGAKYIYLEDLMRFMREGEALKTLSLFEGAKEKNKISRKALKNWMVNAFRERKALALTLDDTKTAVNTLHQMANAVVGIIVFGLSLLILGVATTHFFVWLSSQLLLAAFIFGNTLKTVFESIIFLFVMHPFDVGDRCEVEGIQLIVEEMNIMTTIFLRFDNQKITYPNNVLSTKPIGNFYRSPDMGDSIDFCIHVSTPMEKIVIARERIIGFIQSKKEHWYPDPAVVLRDVDDMNRLKISIWMRHRINFQDMGMKFERRQLVLQEMIRVLRELDIEYRMLPLDVNVRNMPPVNSSRLPSSWITFN